MKLNKFIGTKKVQQNTYGSVNPIAMFTLV